jgi:hypothetical protein
MLSRRMLFSLSLLCAQVSAQSVISTHSGLIHFSEGLVFIDDRPLTPSYGRFSEISENSVLRTEQGKAEVLLTPGVFLRMGENSAIRMISSNLSNTQVEFLKGSAILQSMDILPPDNSVILIYKGWQIRLQQQGLYRVDSDPPQLKVYNGDSEVSLDGKTMVVSERNLFSFPDAVVSERFANETDALDRWADKRSRATSAALTAGASSGSKKSGGPRAHPSVPALPRRTW